MKSSNIEVIVSRLEGHEIHRLKGSTIFSSKWVKIGTHLFLDHYVEVHDASDERKIQEASRENKIGHIQRIMIRTASTFLIATPKTRRQ